MRPEIEYQFSYEKLLIKAAVYMSCGMHPEDACRSFDYVGSQYVAQLTPRDRLATHIDDLRLVHPVFDEPAAAAQRMCRVAEQHKNAG